MSGACLPAFCSGHRRRLWASPRCTRCRSASRPFPSTTHLLLSSLAAQILQSGDAAYKTAPRGARNAHVHADISTLGILVERRTLHPICLLLNPGSRNPLSKPARSLCDGRSRSTAVPTLAHVCRRRTVCLLRALKVHSTLLRYPHGPFHNQN